MARPRKPPGEAGKVRYSARSGKVMARTEVRDGAGVVKYVSATGNDEADAAAALQHKIAGMWGGVFSAVEPETTIAELAEAWLADQLTRLGDDLRPQSYQQYESIVRRLIQPHIWEVRVADMTVIAAEKFLRRLAAEQSPSAAQSARKVLSLMFELAILHGAIPPGGNPIRHVRRLPASKPPIHRAR